MPDDQNSPPTPSNNVIDYPARDMTITVGSAMPVSELRAILSKEIQQLPVDTAADQMSIREMIDQDISGPRQFGYGTLRDYLIGIEACDGSGRVFHAGGRVVKNVAGYDLCRLLIGAEGKLGTLQHVTFKLKPLPAKQTLSIAAFKSIKDLASALDRTNLTETTPVILDVVNRQAANDVMGIQGLPVAQEFLSDGAVFLIVGFDGSKTACEWQSKTIAAELHGTASSVVACPEDEAMNLYCQAAMKFAQWQQPEMAIVQARVVTRPSKVDVVLQIAETFGLLACGRAGNGVMYLRSATTVADVAKLQSELKAVVDASTGCFEFRSGHETLNYPAPEATVERYAESLKKLLG